MLTIKCAKCKEKIMKYKKVGQGRVLKCWERMISRLYAEIEEQQIVCTGCANIIGEVKSRAGKNYVDMNQNQFTYSGRKISK